jgi:hypothetical protein
MHIQNQNTPDSLNGAQMKAEENAVRSKFAMQICKHNNIKFNKKLKGTL